MTQRRRHAGWLAAMPLTAMALLMQPSAAGAQARRDGGTAPRAEPAPTLQLTGNVRGVRSDATIGRQLAIEVLDIDVRIRGGVAETRMTATFRNASDEVLEGDFGFDMPAGSVITGYALDVGPDLIDGVIAGRDRAREAYQRRVVQRIDPGLAEVTWSDRFSTRIFPIPARGSRTIRLVMASPLDPARGYALPMRPAGPIGRLTLSIVTDDGAAPTLSLPRGVFGGWRGGRFTLDRWDAAIAGELRVQPAATTGVQLSRHANGETFFDLLLPEQSGTPREPGRRPIHVFWDRSISRADDRLADEAALLATLHRAVGGAGFQLTLFDSGTVDTRAIANEADLRAALAGVRYGGATSFAQLGSVMVASGATCVLVSDGRATIDTRADFSLPCRTFAVASDREVDRGWLGAVAERTGGGFIELANTTAADAVARILASGRAPISLVDDDDRAIDAIAIGNDGRRLIGLMPDRGGLRLAGSSTRITRPAQDAPLFSGAGALWASRRIAADASDMRTEELVALSRRYAVASPMASFIVLEQPADYVEANIPPPGSYPKPLRDAYAGIRADADRQIAAQQAGRLSEVTAMWDQTRAWWAAKHDPQQRRRQPEPQSADALREEEGDDIVLTGSRNEDMPPPAPPPPPPPAPPPPPVMAPPPPEGSFEEGADVVVTGTVVSAPSLDSAIPVTTITEEELAAESNGDAGFVRQADSGIATAEWSPTRPWIAAIEAAGPRWADAIDRQRIEHGALPLFWFDVAEWHWRAGRSADARRAVESALDLPTRDNQTLEIVAGRLVRYGDLDRALALYAQLADREDERPQPLRQQALVLMSRAELHRAAGRTEAARADLVQAIALIADAVLKVRREQFRGFETLALMDANLAVQRLRAFGGGDHALPPALMAMLDTDIRIVVEWNTPRTDLDLWVTQPDGERVGFSSALSGAGGRLTADVTNGFGPEEFMIRVAPRGTYTVEIDSFASDRTNPNGPSTVAARIIRNFGRPNQSEELIDIEMDPTDDGMRRVGTIEVR